MELSTCEVGWLVLHELCCIYLSMFVCVVLRECVCVWKTACQMLGGYYLVGFIAF